MGIDNSMVDWYSLLSSLDSTVTSNKFVSISGNKITPIQFSKIKAIKTGAYTEFHLPETPYLLGRKKSKNANLTQKKINRTKEYRQRTAKRAIDNIRRLSQGNFKEEYTKHVVLTFGDNESIDLSDIQVCNELFFLFIKRLRKFDKDFKYIRVPEYHKNRNVVHYHMMTDLKYIEQSELEKVRSYGIVFIRKAPVDIAKYLYKYLIKNSMDNRYIGKRTWSHSRNMINSQKIYGDKALELFKKSIKQSKLIYKYEFKSDYNGNIKSFEFIEQNPLPDK